MSKSNLSFALPVKLLYMYSDTDEGSDNVPDGDSALLLVLNEAACKQVALSEGSKSTPLRP
jgi:hypothetical protein